MIALSDTAIFGNEHLCSFMKEKAVLQGLRPNFRALVRVNHIATKSTLKTPETVREVYFARVVFLYFARIVPLKLTFICCTHP